jgi:hypothetical protein
MSRSFDRLGAASRIAWAQRQRTAGEFVRPSAARWAVTGLHALLCIMPEVVAQFCRPVILRGAKNRCICLAGRAEMPRFFAPLRMTGLSMVVGLMTVCIGIGFPAAARAQNIFGSDATEAPVTRTSKRIPSFTTAQKFRFYVQSTFSPLSLTGPVIGAAATQWTSGNPPEWGLGFPGYGRRLLSGYSRQVIANTLGLGVMFADGEDPRHYPTGKHGIWKRGLYAARETFVSRRVSGGEMPDYSRILGAYAAGFVSDAWYPAPYSNTKDALYRGSTALASDIIWQEIKEFWPDVHRKLRARR